MSSTGQPSCAEMFPVVDPPAGVRVTRRVPTVPTGYRHNARQAPAEVEIRARSIGARGWLLLGVTLFWNSVLAMFLVRGSFPTFMILHFAVGAFLVFLSAKQLRNGFVLATDAQGITTTQRTNAGAHAERVDASAVTGFVCEPGTIDLGTVSSASGRRPILRSVHHVCAVLADGRVTRLLVDLERPEVAFFIAQLLTKEFGVPTSSGAPRQLP